MCTQGFVSVWFDLVSTELWYEAAQTANAGQRRRLDLLNSCFFHLHSFSWNDLELIFSVPIRSRQLGTGMTSWQWTISLDT